MANKPEQITTTQARELVRDGDTERLIGDSRAIDELNQSVIKEFRANRGKVGGPMEAMPVLLLTMTGAKTDKPSAEAVRKKSATAEIRRERDPRVAIWFSFERHAGSQDRLD